MGYTLVQSYTTNSTTVGYASTTNVIKHSMTFVASEDYALTKVEFGLMKVGSPTGNLNVYIYAVDVNKYPTGAALATSETTVDIATLTTSVAYYAFTFAAPANLTNGVRYAIVVAASKTNTSGNNVTVKGGASSGNRVSSYIAAWATESDNYSGLFYAYKTESTVPRFQINIGDAWKTVVGVQINIGDSWKTVTAAQINIGDSWKAI